MQYVKLKHMRACYTCCRCSQHDIVTVHAIVRQALWKGKAKEERIRTSAVQDDSCKLQLRQAGHEACQDIKGSTGHHTIQQ